MFNLERGWSESAFNIQEDEVSEMLQEFIIEIYILESSSFPRFMKDLTGGAVSSKQFPH